MELKLMHKMNFTPFPTLTTEHLCLRQITLEDLNEFFILKSDIRLLKHYNGKAKTYEEAKQFLYKITDEIVKNEWILWGITLNNENRIVGSICFWNVSEEHFKAEIGYELMYDQQGKGIMQEAIIAVIDYGFKHMKLQLIEALPSLNNTKSIKLLERNRFIKGSNITETVSSSSLKGVFYTLRNNA